MARSNDALSPERVFRLFVERTEKMKRRRIFDDGVPRIAYKQTVGGSNYRFELSAPDEEDYRSFLLDLRPFLLVGDPIHFEYVHNLLAKRLTDKALLADCRHNRKDWDRVKRGHEAFNINGVSYEAIDFFQAVAYGDIFHVDADKRAWLATLPQSVQDWARFNLYSVGLNAARVISPQANLIRTALERGVLDLGDRPARAKQAPAQAMRHEEPYSTEVQKGN
ncbi:hypothetical protein [Jidongwangia harbinensis]|uniref:hypothetical protein n=1 Tax=Jidongwangia harbinensis TaxID=2878561 RepID=UPI001CDA1B33|nr:hypothetical protein [Jidongwangia harbinensis]MCA2216907.1 hypothetical protein [Jidongwangia harbinensis]